MYSCVNTWEARTNSSGSWVAPEFADKTSEWDTRYSEWRVSSSVSHIVCHKLCGVSPPVWDWGQFGDCTLPDSLPGNACCKHEPLSGQQQPIPCAVPGVARLKSSVAGSNLLLLRHPWRECGSMVVKW